MLQKVIGIFSVMWKGKAARRQLIASSATLVSGPVRSGTLSRASETTTCEGIDQKINSFFHELMDGAKDVESDDAKGTTVSEVLLGATCVDQHRSESLTMLTQYGAREVENRILTDIAGNTFADSANAEVASPLVEEWLHICKREAIRGGWQVLLQNVDPTLATDALSREENVPVSCAPVSCLTTVAGSRTGQSPIELNATEWEPVVDLPARARR